MSSSGPCFEGWGFERHGCSRLGGGVSHARRSGEVGGYKYVCIRSHFGSRRFGPYGYLTRSVPLVRWSVVWGAGSSEGSSLSTAIWLFPFAHSSAPPLVEDTELLCQANRGNAEPATDTTARRRRDVGIVETR